MLSPRPFLLLMAACMSTPAIAVASTEKAKTEVLTQAAPAGTSPAITVDDSLLTAGGLERSSYATVVLEKRLKASMEQKSQCYTMRSYKFKREGTASDELRPSGGSTCESASIFSLKDAVISK